MSESSKPLRILQILPELNEGGVERGVVELNRELVVREIESHVISKGGALVQQIERDGGRHHMMDVSSKNPFTVPLRAHLLKKKFREIQPSIIHARSRVPAWLCKFANKNPKFPFVTTVHGINRPNVYSRIMVSGDRVICVGEPVRQHIDKHYAPDPKIVTVIPRGVDMQAFDPENIPPHSIEDLKKQLGIEGKKIIGSVGRISHVKGFEVVIEAASIVARNRPDLVCVIFGGVHPKKAEYAKRLENLAKSVMPGKVLFPGSFADMPLAYACCDVLVNASPKMGNVARTIIEAIAMNVPVLSTKLEGLEGLVQNGMNGYIFESGNTRDLAQKLELLLDSPPKNVRETMCKEFTLDHMVESVLQVYHSLSR